TPVTRHGDRGSETRLYFMWTTTGPLQRFDTELLVGAGLGVSGKHVLKFVPAELESELARIEMEYAREHGHDRVAEIAQTVFESQPVDGGYRFEVLEQKYRR